MVPARAPAWEQHCFFDGQWPIHRTAALQTIMAALSGASQRACRVSQLSYTLNHCDAKVAIVGKQYEALIKEVLAEVSRPVEIIFAGNDDRLDTDEIPSRCAVSDTAGGSGAFDVQLRNISGQPNAAIHTHRSLLAHSRNSASRIS